MLPITKWSLTSLLKSRYLALIDQLGWLVGYLLERRVAIHVGEFALHC